MTTRKLVIGTKTVGGLPKEKPPRVSMTRRVKEAFKSLRLTPEEEDLTIKVYGQETDSPGFDDLEDERVLGLLGIRVRVRPSPERATWHQTEGPEGIRIVSARYVLVTRVTCTLPLALQELRPGYEQDLPIVPYRVRAGDSLDVRVPSPVIAFS